MEDWVYRGLSFYQADYDEVTGRWGSSGGEQETDDSDHGG